MRTDLKKWRRLPPQASSEMALSAVELVGSRVELCDRMAGLLDAIYRILSKLCLRNIGPKLLRTCVDN